MIPIWFAISYLISEIHKKRKVEYNLEEAKRNYKPVEDKYKHYRLDMWCESWLAGNLPNEVLLKDFEKRDDGHWHRTGDKGSKE